eukprot:6419723-Alexandrium_andersonii.AAC.1
MSLDSSEEFVDFRFVDPTTAAQLNQCYMELRAKLAQVDSELGALRNGEGHRPRSDHNVAGRGRRPC